MMNSQKIVMLLFVISTAGRNLSFSVFHHFRISRFARNDIEMKFLGERINHGTMDFVLALGEFEFPIPARLRRVNFGFRIYTALFGISHP